MATRRVLLPLLVIALTGGTSFGQTSKYLTGDTLLIPPATEVEFIGGGGFTTQDAIRAVVVGKKYPYWFIDFDLGNGSVDSSRVGNSFLLTPGVINVSLEARDQGLEQNRKLSRMGVDVQGVGGRVEQAIQDLAAAGVPLLLKFSFDKSAEGGVEPKVRVYNISGRRIRTITIDFRGLDERGTLVPCTRSGNTSHIVTVNGPIEPDAECYYAFVNAPSFFNDATDCLEIDSVTVEFMDGESIVMIEDLAEIQGLLKNPFMRAGQCPG